MESDMQGSVVETADRLRSGDPADRAAAAHALAHCGQPLTPVLVELVKAAGDRDDDTRMWAAEALETAGPPNIDQLPALIGCLRTDPRIRDGETAYWAAKLLGRLGPAAAPAAETLAQTLADSPFLAVREQAATALGRMGAHAATATAVLVAASQDGPPRLKRLALAALDAIRGMAA